MAKKGASKKKTLKTASKPLSAVEKAKAALDENVKSLKGAQFRQLNETLYTQNSEESFALLQENKELFDKYHEGFSSQRNSGWEVNPADLFLTSLKKMPEKRVVADFGCGEAKIAQELQGTNKTVHSFDLVAGNEFITACNIKNVPLPDESVDIVIFSLSLMGPDYPEFIKEANRVLKKNGQLWIAEVGSRMKEKGPQEFEDFICRLGFHMKKEFVDHNYFIIFTFRKTKATANRACKECLAVAGEYLAPCLYKKR